MNTYIGTKTVIASPMTRQAYNDLRGWELPADEDGSDAGYLVEYVDGGKPNMTGHAGYVSWSPADVFERAYTEVPYTPADRVRAELGELMTKTNGLVKFISGSVFATLPLAERQRMNRQLRIMREYAEVLVERLDSMK